MEITIDVLGLSRLQSLLGAISQKTLLSGYINSQEFPRVLLFIKSPELTLVKSIAAIRYFLGGQ